MSSEFMKDNISKYYDIRYACGLLHEEIEAWLKDKADEAVKSRGKQIRYKSRWPVKPQIRREGADDVAFQVIYNLIKHSKYKRLLFGIWWDKDKMKPSGDHLPCSAFIGLELKKANELADIVTEFEGDLKENMVVTDWDDEDWAYLMYGVNPESPKDQTIESIENDIKNLAEIVMKHIDRDWANK